ncbi:DsbA family oxidoreductase [Streptomyces clavuligerus]|uniref:Predicted dithiol-disulfide isomerase involved in polyketide biosynthesis n=1 Tax=Streptomyces clavuligerus TaxID=1901 RepID=B5GN23_STRCL|nr:DsbA family oxidoreductase [Streptomyces clavuligerus]ANW22225.1 disulfide bond formation protein DsbA [Streptomyces clavuligerus]AXU17119.1 DsbA family oxidoreductase [Streptomyces clavuligerus]EDY47719.1 DSBA oxidoreductase [Streptomyces clavuligerus]EFG04289.1 Predicted dithiol-disulfide isomerase involved in polyketide biosynthesis [Streptomyces clavuligerus]MBY6307236.1 DsbA family oxidoreductase [Streptomyces clavuligerus]
MRIEIWADVVCPWAFIGKRRLEQALAARADRGTAGGEPAEVVWRPFRIDPTAPAAAVPLDEALRDPLMDEALRACAPGLTPAQNRVRVSRVAAAEGLGPRWGAHWRVSSHDAHRLLALTLDHAGAAAQDAVAEGVLRAHFLEGRDIGSRAVLGGIAVRAGFPEGPRLLETNAGERLVRELLLEGRARGVRTSPSFVVGERALAGAQSPGAIGEFLDGHTPRAEPPAEAVRMRWAESLLEQRDALGALTLLAPLLADFPDDRGVRTLAARAYFASAQLNRARTVLEPLVDEWPDDMYARLLYGRTLQRLGLAPEAEAQLRLTTAGG